MLLLRHIYGRYSLRWVKNRACRHRHSSSSLSNAQVLGVSLFQARDKNEFLKSSNLNYQDNLSKEEGYLAAKEQMLYFDSGRRHEIGWKAGATAGKHPNPFHGPIPPTIGVGNQKKEVLRFMDTETATTITQSEFVGLRGFEAEWVFQLKGTSAEVASVWDAFEQEENDIDILASKNWELATQLIEAVYPAIEIGGSRILGTRSIPMMVADGSGNVGGFIGGYLLSKTHPNALGAQLHCLADNAVRLQIMRSASKEVLMEKEGSGRDVLGHPVHSLLWVINDLRKYGRVKELQSVKYFYTGSTTGPPLLPWEEMKEQTEMGKGYSYEVVASFEDYGDIKLTLRD